MAYYLFVDERGIDRRESPYEVLAGLCVDIAPSDTGTFFSFTAISTSLIQVADLLASITSWAFRTGSMNESGRAELGPYVDQIAALRYQTCRERMGNTDFRIWSFAIIDDCVAGRIVPMLTTEVEKRQ